MERRDKLDHVVKERERVRMDAVQKKWNRREENEFLRVLTGYGVDLQSGTAVPTPDWIRFKAMAKLDKKTDESLSDYYKVFIAMCKRQAGVRLSEDEKGLEGIIDDISEDHARLVLDRLELLSKLREIVRNSRLDDRLKLCQNNFDTPDWWESGKHDKELIRAVLKHGLYRSEYYIFNDPEFSYGKSERLFIEEVESHLIRAQQAEAEDQDNKERIIKLEKGDSTMQIEKVKKEETYGGNEEMAPPPPPPPLEAKAKVEALVIEETVVIKDDDSDTEMDTAEPAKISDIEKVPDEVVDEANPATVAEEKKDDDEVKTEEKVDSPVAAEPDISGDLDEEEMPEETAESIKEVENVIDEENSTEVSKQAEEDETEKEDEPATAEVAKEIDDEPKDDIEEMVVDKPEPPMSPTKGDTKTPETTPEVIVVEPEVVIVSEEDDETAEKSVTDAITPSSDDVKVKEEDESILDGKGDPDDDEVMKEKEKAVEEECKKQAAELKARFPDLEVIQPLVKVKTSDLKEVRGKCCPILAIWGWTNQIIAFFSPLFNIYMTAVLKF